ncbi:MAG TPA: hypothetical protein DDX37_01725, partial [Candidatus Omnitrophica bacterium]|nr:hypothetical protein [Candidatus Omnitrophota bacterium]
KEFVIGKATLFEKIMGDKILLYEQMQYHAGVLVRVQARKLHFIQSDFHPTRAKTYLKHTLDKGSFEVSKDGEMWFGIEAYMEREIERKRAIADLEIGEARLLPEKTVQWDEVGLIKDKLKAAVKAEQGTVSFLIHPGGDFLGSVLNGVLEPVYERTDIYISNLRKYLSGATGVVFVLGGFYELIKDVRTRVVIVEIPTKRNNDGAQPIPALKTKGCDFRWSEWNPVIEFMKDIGVEKLSHFGGELAVVDEYNHVKKSLHDYGCVGGGLEFLSRYFSINVFPQLCCGKGKNAHLGEKRIDAGNYWQVKAENGSNLGQPVKRVEVQKPEREPHFGSKYNDKKVIFRALNIDTSKTVETGKATAYVSIEIQGYDPQVQGKLLLLIYKGKPVCVLKENNGEHEKRYLFDAGFFELDHKVDREIRRRWLKDNFGPLLEGVDMSDINIKGIWRSNEESLSGSSLKKVLYYFRGVFACGINSTIPMIRIMERQFEDKNKFRHVLDIGCGAGTLGLIALEKARIGRITAIDSNVFALVSTMLNYQLAGRRKALNIKYGCLRKQEAWDELRRTGEFDYVLFNAAFPVDEDDPRGSDVTMYDQGGIVRNKFIDNVQELLSATGKAQVLSDSGFESQAKQNGMKVHYKGTNPEGLNFYIVSSEKSDSDKDDNDTLGAQVLDAGYAMGIIITAALIVVSLLFLTLKAVIAFVVTKEFLIIFAGGLIISLIIFSGFNKLFEPIYSAYPTGFYFKDVKEVFRTIFKAYHKVWEIMSWPAYLIWKYYTFRVHEGAHYLAARALKLTVNGVDYSEENKGIARTYVKLTGLKNWKILLITLAGPLANLISGTIFLWAVDFERLTAMDWYMLPAYFGICLAALEYSTFVLNLMPTSNLPLGRGTKDGDLIIRSLQLLWKGKKTFYSYSEPEKRNAFQARRINRPGSHDFRLLLLMVPIYGWVLGSIYRKLVHGDERKIRITKKENLSREVSWAVAEKIRELQKDPERVVRVVLATGNTMVGFLDSLSREKDIDWTRVYAYHLDEYKGLDTENRYSFAYYLNRHLFSKVKGIPRENIRYVNGKDPDLNGYIREIEDNGGADIVMLGIGKNGHLGFNEPGTSFWSRMREIKLTASTIKANKPDYPDIEAMPYAYTMGLRNIFRGKHLFFVASGEGKAEIVKKALEGRVTNKVPGSLIQMHPRADIFLDEEAA